MSGKPERFLEAAAIAPVVDRLARAVDLDHPEGALLVGVLKGAAFLVADLARALSVPCTVDFLALSPYAGRGARVRILKDLDVDVTGRDVVLVECVVDTGRSAGYLVRLLGDRGARRVSVCTLLDRPGRRIVPLKLAYVGLEAPEAYLVGYGLDLRERYRNLPDLYALPDLGAPSSRDVDELAPGAPGHRYDTALYASRGSTRRT